MPGAEERSAEIGAIVKAALLDMDYAITVYLEASEEARLKAEAEARALEQAKAAEREAQRRTETAAIKSAPAQRAVTLRTYWSAVIEDEGAAIDSYRTHPTVRKAMLAAVLQAANEDARTAKDESKAPPGVRFVKEERAQ